jgi:hypothetical protein
VTDARSGRFVPTKILWQCDLQVNKWGQIQRISYAARNPVVGTTVIIDNYGSFRTH